MSIRGIEILLSEFEDVVIVVEVNEQFFESSYLDEIRVYASFIVIQRELNVFPRPSINLFRLPKRRAAMLENSGKLLLAFDPDVNIWWPFVVPLVQRQGIVRDSGSYVYYDIIAAKFRSSKKFTWIFTIWYTLLC